MATSKYNYSVFINCPFDPQYRPLMEAIVFAVQDCGYAARSALEVSDTSQVRFEKIATIISACKFGIHDISRTDLDAESRLPRFNMPLELGLFLGAKRFGSGRHKAKNCIVLDLHQYRYQQFISDIAGQDIAAHGGEPVRAIKIIRNWLSDATPKSIRTPGGASIAARYEQFRADLPETCAKLQLQIEDLTFNDYVVQVEEWIQAQAQVAR